ncbi:MAG: tRNA-dihydrouridine synthase family protein [Candidatus Pacearchaeota archaeon]|nr:tRNA-dihydrouridine synthase family protein [Candidatus Pacearchaeota archaeon]
MKLPFKNKILLAPMEEVNDIAFRLLCKKAGAGITYTGLTSPLTKQKIILDDKPVLQLFATSTKGIKEFMSKYDKQVCMWDFNLGCPAVNAKRRGFGAFLKDLDVIEKILQEMRRNTKKPLGVKFRKSDISFEIVKLAEKYCDIICIHPRTQAQGYSGEADIEFAKKIKNSTKLPVIYSGNIDNKNYKKFLKDFNYVMIGRYAIGNPDIFSEISGSKKKFSYKDWLKLAKKYQLPFRQMKFQAMSFSKGIKNSRKLRNNLATTKKMEEIEELL